VAIAVVADSTAYLPASLAGRYPIRTVPLHVSVNGAHAVDEIAFGPAELATAFDRKQRVTTSGATAQELARTYRALLAEGYDGVVSVHLSRRLSGTWNAAGWAAREVDPHRVRVMDSRSTAMGLGFAVLAAAKATESNSDLSTVEATAARVAERTRTLFSVQTLDYLHRGGRIGTAAAALGTALNIKPLLRIRQGRIEALEKVRTTARAVTRLVEVSASAAGTGPVAVAVHHLAAPDRARDLADRLQERLGECEECAVSEVGAVIGAHLGPGALGVVVLPGGWEHG
jgi:DegV family protein with EDD domain